MNKRKDPIMTMVNIRMTSRQAEELRREAFDSNQSMAAVVRGVLEQRKIISPSVEK